MIVFIHRSRFTLEVAPKRPGMIVFIHRSRFTLQLAPKRPGMIVFVHRGRFTLQLAPKRPSLHPMVTMKTVYNGDFGSFYPIVVSRMSMMIVSLSRGDITLQLIPKSSVPHLVTMTAMGDASKTTSTCGGLSSDHGVPRIID